MDVNTSIGFDRSIGTLRLLVHECGLETCTSDELEQSSSYLGRVWCPGNGKSTTFKLVPSETSRENEEQDAD